MSSKLRIGIDVGGTFTDLVASDGTAVRVIKVPSTPPAFESGVLQALHAVLDHFEADEIELIHGSTVATNALLERSAPPCGLITSRGFRDILHLGRQNRPDLYALQVERRSPLVETEHCFGVSGRCGADGREVESLDEAAVSEAALRLRAGGIRHAAVCLLFSFVNPEQEKRVGEILREHNIAATLSSEVAPEFREYERASTTVATARLRPTVTSYLDRLREQLPKSIGRIRILHGGGGTYSVEQAASHAGRLILSGPAGGVAGAAAVADRLKLQQTVAFDMGGTSTDVTLLTDGKPLMAHQHTIDELPIRLPMLDIHTIGAGGGSIATLDAGGSLRVGPASAGANPGPACYGRGGTDATVTDANLLLGRIPAGTRFGTISLSPEAASEALNRLGRQMNCSAEEAALGVVRVAEQHMAQAVRQVTVRRGVDPRGATLISFGGAGGLHACAIAELLNMQQVTLPPMAGVLSAAGMVGAAESAEQAQTTLQLDERGLLDDDRLYAELGRLNARAMDELPTDRTTAIEAMADCRWAGQSHELTVRIERPSRQRIEAAFRAVYEPLYGPSADGARLQIVTLRLRRTGSASPLPWPRLEPDPAGFEQDDGPLRRASREGLLFHGFTPAPLLLLDPDATAFVPPGWGASCDEHGFVRLTRLER